MNFDRYIIQSSLTIKDALVLLNTFGSGEPQTLFICEEGKVIGTITDGDIRRALVKGVQIDSCVTECAHTNFSYLVDKSYDVRQIHKAKEKGIELLPVLNSQMQIVDIVNLRIQKSYLPIDAVMMAGGKGERLRPLTEKTPKPLLELNGKAIIDYIVEHIISYGIKNISVTVNYLKEQIEDHFALPIQDIQVQTVREPKYLGTIGSLSYVKYFRNDTVLLMNSDAITDINLEDFYLHFRENNADMSVAAIPYTVSVPYGILDLDGRNVKGILEKPTYNYYANAGIYLIKRELLNLIPEGEFFNATDFMELLVTKGYNVIRFPLNGTWIDIGNKQDFQKAQEIVKHIKW